MFFYQKNLEDTLKNTFWVFFKCPTKPSLCQVFKALTNDLKFFKLTKQAPDSLKWH